MPPVVSRAGQVSGPAVDRRRWGRFNSFTHPRLRSSRVSSVFEIPPEDPRKTLARTPANIHYYQENPYGELRRRRFLHFLPKSAAVGKSRLISINWGPLKIWKSRFVWCKTYTRYFLQNFYVHTEILALPEAMFQCNPKIQCNWPISNLISSPWIWACATAVLCIVSRTAKVQNRVYVCVYLH